MPLPWRPALAAMILLFGASSCGEDSLSAAPAPAPESGVSRLEAGSMDAHKDVRTVDATPPVDSGARDAVARETGALEAGSLEAGSPDSARVPDANPLLDGGYDLKLPRGFPSPVVPNDNPLTQAKIDLGRHLFYDKRLSHNQQQSCSSCHRQELAFTDGLAHAVGSTGMQHPRSSMSLANIAYASTLTWANPLQTDLEHQALVPMFGDDPIELGLTSTPEIEQRLAGIPIYVTLFKAAWPLDPSPVTLDHLVQALASFERILISGRSPFDRWQYGDQAAITESAKRGYALLNSEKMECFHCHVGFDLTDHVHWSSKAFLDRPYHNTGLYNLPPDGAYPEPNTGVFHVTHRPEDMGRFKAPTLRNIAVTGPYMHDGSIATLDEVLDHYAAGGRTIATGPYAGNGNLNPHKDPVIEPLQIGALDRTDVIAFLESLTDTEFLHDRALASPW